MKNLVSAIMLVLVALVIVLSVLYWQALQLKVSPQAQVALPAEKFINLEQINLTSSVPGIAQHTDLNLTDSWGLEFGDPGRIWVNAQSGYSIVYNGTGSVVVSNSILGYAGVPTALRVLVPGAPQVPGPAPLTGLVFIPGHTINGPFNGDAFIFVSEDGVIAGWHPLANGTDPLNATIEVNNYVNNNESGAVAVYKGVTAVDTPSGWMLYVANFGQGQIDVYNSTFSPVNTIGKFIDPNMPSNFAPFNIYSYGGLLYVSYAKQSIDKQNDVKGLGNGYIDVFYDNGTFDKRLISGGYLNSPWGMAIAPSDYGTLSGDLLVGNFGDGHIDIYNPANGTYIGTVGSNGTALQIDDLWALTFGTNNGAGADNQLFFTAGSSAESQGIFGELYNPQVGQNEVQ